VSCFVPAPVRCWCSAGVDAVQRAAAREQVHLPL
jgi:hypothetical protein